MKALLTTLLAMISFYFGNVQCVGFAGEDTTLCDPYNSVGFIQLGSLDNTIDTTNYNFEWSAIFDKNLESEQFLDSASQVLSNIHALNPTIINYPIGKTQFILQISDSLDNTCFDTLNLEIGGAILCLADCIQGVNLGDSITVSNMCIRPLVEPVIVNEITVAPTQTTSYNITMTDGIGCEYSESCTVMVLPTSINETELPEIKVLNNPIKNNLIFNVNILNLENLQFEIQDLSGKIITSDLIQRDNFINTSNFSSGIYVLKILKGSQILAIKKLLKSN